MAGYQTPGDSGSQRSAGTSISWAEALPGDIVGFPGHVAIYLGTFGGRPYILEASWVGTPIHIVPLTRTDFDDRVHRYWTGPAVRAPGVADFGAVVRGYTPLMTGNSGTSIYSGWTGAGSSSGSTPQRIYSSTIPRLQPRPWPAPVTQTPPAPVVQAPVVQVPVETSPVATVTPAPQPTTPKPSRATTPTRPRRRRVRQRDHDDNTDLGQPDDDHREPDRRPR